MFNDDKAKIKELDDRLRAMELKIAEIIRIPQLQEGSLNSDIILAINKITKSIKKGY